MSSRRDTGQAGQQSHPSRTSGSVSTPGGPLPPGQARQGPSSVRLPPGLGGRWRLTNLQHHVSEWANLRWNKDSPVLHLEQRHWGRRVAHRRVIQSVVVVVRPSTVSPCPFHRRDVVERKHTRKSLNQPSLRDPRCIHAKATNGSNTQKSTHRPAKPTGSFVADLRSREYTRFRLPLPRQHGGGPPRTPPERAQGHQMHQSPARQNWYIVARAPERVQGYQMHQSPARVLHQRQTRAMALTSVRANARTSRRLGAR